MASNPPTWVNAILNLIGGSELQHQQTEARQTNEARYADIISRFDALSQNLNRIQQGGASSQENLLGNLLGRTVGGAGVLAADVNRRFSARTQGGLGFLNSLMNQVNTGYQQRLDRAMGMLGDYGTQTRADINQRFDEQQSSQAADLASRGLGGTTILNTIRSGLERERGAELRRFGEDVQRLRTGLYSDLSGQGLAARERLGGLYSATYGGLTAEQLAAQERGGERTLGYDIGLTGALADTMGRNRAEQLALLSNIGLGKLGFMERREDTYPQTNAMLQFAQAFGQNSAPTPQPQTDWASLATQWTGTGLTMKIMVACLDEHTMLDTPDGPVSLRDVKVGDRIMVEGGKFAPVVTKVFGKAHAKPYGHYWKIAAGDKHIIVSEDHLIDGKAAAEWETGETMMTATGRRMITAMHPATSKHMGDILVEGNRRYYANNFICHSMIAEYEPEFSALEAGHAD